MKAQKLNKIEDCDVLNKTLLELTGTSPKEMETQNFIDLTITFSLKKDETEAKPEELADSKPGEYEILKNVPDVRVYYGDAKSKKTQISAYKKAGQLKPLFLE